MDNYKTRWCLIPIDVGFVAYNSFTANRRYAMENTEQSMILELGDRVIIDSKKYGRVVGTIYYRDGLLIRVMPDGAPDVLYDFPRIYTDEEDKFADELGVEQSYILGKRKSLSFVEQQTLQEGQIFETIRDRNIVETYKNVKILSVNKELDSIHTDRGEIEFGFVGIPLDLSFDILRITKIELPKEVSEIPSLGTPIKPGEPEPGLVPEEGETFASNVSKRKIRLTGSVLVPIIREYKELDESKKIYSQALQKVDALNDFINMLDSSSQKNKTALRAVRILVESIYELKNMVVDYNPDGTFKGISQNVAPLLSDLLKTQHIPISRPVLDISKRLYNRTDDEQSIETTGYYTLGFMKELADMDKDIVLPTSGDVIRFWRETRGFLKKYSMPFKEQRTLPIYDTRQDTDFFRGIPSIETPDIDGYLTTKDANILGKLKISYNRSISSTFHRTSEIKKQVLVSGDKTHLLSYALFEPSRSASIGNTRSGNAAIDSARSQMTHEYMKQTEIPNILFINSDSTISLSNYIEKILKNSQHPVINATSMEDVNTLLSDLGLNAPNSVGLSEDQFLIFQTHFRNNQKRLVSHIASLRTDVKNMTKNSNVSETIPDFVPSEDISKWIELEPVLVDELSNFKYYNPSLSTSATAICSHLMKKYLVHFLMSSGKELFLAKERFRTSRTLYTNNLNEYKNLLKKQQESGKKPEANPCEHVSKLVSIRKIKDVKERYETMIKFFVKYQSEKRINNYTMCNICDRTLLCTHEVMQIQEFLNKKERDIIHKNIILSFAGGQFGGYYICKNCGQAIDEIGFDTHIEYDDNGKPMMGRSVLVDKDQVTQEEIDDALRDPLDEKKDLDFGSPENNEYYKIIREIVERVGVFLEKDTYAKIIKRMALLLEKLKGKATPELFTKNLVCSAGYLLLTEIQTNIPGYIPKYSFHGCVPAFRGIPIEEGNSGVKYISCVISNINIDSYPWNKTKFLQTKLDDRKNNVLKVIETIHKYYTQYDTTIRDDIHKKKEYILQKGAKAISEKFTSEIIPDSFLPKQTRVTPEVLAKEPISAETLTSPALNKKLTSENTRALSINWIRQANIEAKTSSIDNLHGTSLETVCCLHDIKDSSEFWKGKTPSIPGRSLKPNITGKFLQGVIEPRPLHKLTMEVPESLTYRLFLKICHDGPRKGMIHEPGLSFRCMWCGFQFPTNPNVMTDKEGLDALISQGIDIGKEKFYNLLDIVRKNNKIPPFLLKERDILAWNILEDMNVPPVMGWKPIISETREKMKSIVSNTEISVALGLISDKMSSLEDIIFKHVHDRVKDVLLSIINTNSETMFQVLLTYFLLPIQRIVTNFDKKSIFIPSELNLSDMHVDTVQGIIDRDYVIINRDISEFTLNKMKNFVNKLSSILYVQSKINETNIGKIPMEYIKGIFVLGSLQSLYEPDDIDMQVSDSEIEISNRQINAIVVSILGKYEREKLPFDPVKIREMIEIRNEKEKTLIIADMNIMTADQKAVALVSKKLGLGKWAVGGTKAIYAYDQDQYDREREDRLRAGIIDFPETGIAGQDIPGRDGRAVDQIGLYDYNVDANYEREGYEHEQTNPEDS